MKVLRLKLVNFIGIKHGTGRDEIEIDFTKGKNKICLLAGENGSGKSTLLSMMNPFKDSFDDRKNLIIEGTIGEKEIDFEYKGSIYKIHHIYSTPAQSFITKDGVEMNDTGGVRLFEEYIEKEFNVNRDYKKILKIGNNTETFVDLSTKERKEYLGQFLNIEEILDKFKLVAEKLKQIKKDITTTSTELKKFSDKDVIESQIKQISEQKNNVDAQIAELYQNQGALNTEISRLGLLVNGKSVTDLMEEVKNISKELSDFNKTITELQGELRHTDEAEFIKNKLIDEINKLQTEIEVLNNEKKNTHEDITNLGNKIISDKSELKSLGNPDDIKKANQTLEESIKERDRLAELIKKNPMGQKVHGWIKEKKNISDYLTKFVSFTDFVEMYFNNLSEKSITTSKINVEFFFDEDFKTNLNSQRESAKNAIISKKELLEEKTKERGIKESYISDTEILKKRPSDCTNNSCVFIKRALEHQNIEKEIALLDDEIKAIKKDIESLNVKFENLQLLNTLYINFLNSYTTMLPRENLVYAEFISNKTLVNWLKSPLSEFQKYRHELSDNISEAQDNIKDYVDIIVKIKRYEELKKTLEDSDSSIRDKYLKDISENEEKLTNSKNKLKDLETQATELSNKVVHKREIKGKYENYINTLSKITIYTDNLENKKKELDELKQLLEDKRNRESDLYKNSNSITELTKFSENSGEQILDLNAQLAQQKQLLEKLDSLNKNFEPISTVHAALSPTTGIPLILMKTYLNETEAIANDLLSIAFGEDFKIKFVTTDKDFSIQVLAKDNIKPDIKIASQGEIAITTIAISLALIEQSMSDYNILCLDEIDGPLDRGNRALFIDILNKQIDKLGLEQIFIISHNDAFDTADIDLVLLNDHGIDIENDAFMENKSVVFNIDTD